MKPEWTDYPLGLFLSATRSTAGGLLTLTIALCCGTQLGLLALLTFPKKLHICIRRCTMRHVKAIKESHIGPEATAAGTPDGGRRALRRGPQPRRGGRRAGRELEGGARLVPAVGKGRGRGPAVHHQAGTAAEVQRRGCGGAAGEPVARGDGPRLRQRALDPAAGGAAGQGADRQEGQPLGGVAAVAAHELEPAEAGAQGAGTRRGEDQALEAGDLAGALRQGRAGAADDRVRGRMRVQPEIDGQEDVGAKRTNARAGDELQLEQALNHRRDQPAEHLFPDPRGVDQERTGHRLPGAPAALHPGQSAGGLGRPAGAPLQGGEGIPPEHRGEGLGGKTAGLRAGTQSHRIPVGQREGLGPRQCLAQGTLGAFAAGPRGVVQEAPPAETSAGILGADRPGPRRPALI